MSDKRKRYTSEQMERVLSDVKTGLLTYRQVADKYNNIPKTTLLHHFKWVVAEHGRICYCIFLMDCIRDYLVKHGIQTKFKDGCTTPKWFIGFKRRHKELILKGRNDVSYLDLKRLPTGDSVFRWYQAVRDACIALGCDSLLEDRSRIFSLVEMAVNIKDADGIILKKYHFNKKNLMKTGEYLSVVICGNGAGVLCPSFVLSSSLVQVECLPSNWEFGKCFFYFFYIFPSF